MNNVKTILVSLAALIFIVGCESDSDDDTPLLLDAGTLSGGPFSFVVDGVPDMVSGISLSNFNGEGDVQSFVITDDSRNILGLPPTFEALEGVDFDGAGIGLCYIYHITYQTGLTGLEAGQNLDGLSGEFDLSNFIMVNRGALNAGTLSGGPYEFVVDGIPDMVANISLDDTNLTGETQTYVITDDSRNILGIPPTLDAVMGVDFDGAGVGSCYIYHLTYSTGLNGLASGENLDNLTGEFALSNFIVVDRIALNAGSLTGGPYDFVVDGNPDMVSAITLDDTELNGENQTYIITDDNKNILGIPPTLDAVMGVDFDGAGVGSCYIYHLTYSTGLEGLESGGNLDSLEGSFAVSNFVTVNRDALIAGTLSGGPFMFTVDGTPDMVSGINLDDTALTGSNQGYVITDEELNILGLPPTLDAVEGVDFDGAGIGVCLIWHITYEDGLTGLIAGENAANLDGFFALSNSIRVYRNPNAGVISGGPFSFNVDGMPDMVNGIMLDATSATGTNRTWIITDDQGTILGIPPTLAAVEGVDFDGAGAGVCLIWYMRYEDGLTGLEMGNNISELQGLYGLSNSITVTRN
ncbi:hypothetical protein GCM10011414_24490 [Croceivirga lutea]|uniref:hypothetical protein n=1 Tax=Croceivirga lutea TaxID=1775167 RepID=UPI0019BF3E28|nr:hypothetical protein [Croceivirga lutea]GGG53883.1 hypothetical protein GCM10011414_24490 [Croceivirga lutea]